MQQISTLLPQLQRDTALLSTCPKTVVEAYGNENTPRLASLTRDCSAPVVELAIGVVLMEVFNMTLSPATTDQLAAMAEEIRTQFYYLSYDEIVFALKHGINGAYGQHYGHINYQHIANWMNGFLAERENGIQRLRDKNHERANSKGEAIETLKGLPKELVESIGIMAEKASAQKSPSINQNEINHRLRDGEKLVQFDRHKEKIQTERILEIIDGADEQELFRTWVSACKELDARINIPFRNLIDRVYDGQTEFDVDDQKLIERYKPELFIELKRLHMILGFEEETKPLTEIEKELLPQFIKGLQKQQYHGKGNEITNKSIREGYARKGKKVSDSRIRKIINHIRANNLVPKLCANSRGYFIAKTDQELDDYITSLKQRVAAIRKVLNSLEEQRVTVSDGKKRFRFQGPNLRDLDSQLELKPDKPNA